MAANCAQLRQSLAHLQSQLNVLTNKKETKEEPPKQEKGKKSKSKKNKDKQAQKVVEELSDAKETTENEPSANKDKAQNPAVEEKVDEKTIESLIQAINGANINLCNLEVINDGNDNENVDEVLGVQINEVAIEANEIPKKNYPIINDVNPTNANEIISDMKVETTKVELKNEVLAEVNSNEVNSNTELNVSLNEVNSNEEVSHIPEVKPISVDNA